MQITSHFSLDELTFSQTATRYGIDNEPSPEIIENLKRVAGVLEDIRSLVNMPIIVSSGYRSPALNRAVGGSGRSAHMLGLAADINASRMSPLALARLIANSSIRFDQLIMEFGRWVHVGLSSNLVAPRGELLTAKKANGRTQYVKGLE